MQSRDLSSFAEPQPSLAIYVAKLQKIIEITKEFTRYFHSFLKKKGAPL